MQEGWPPDQHKHMRAAERETARLDDGLAILFVAFRFITLVLSMQPNTQRIRSAPYTKGQVPAEQQSSGESVFENGQMIGAGSPSDHDWLLGNMKPG